MSVESAEVPSSRSRVLWIVGGLFAIGLVAAVVAGLVGPGLGAEADAVDRSTIEELAEADAAGFAVDVGGEQVASWIVGSNVASAESLAAETGQKESDLQVAEGAVAAVVYSSVLESVGRERGKPVSAAEIEEAVRSATGIENVYTDGQPESSRSLKASQDDMLSDPKGRASVETMLYRARGLAAVVDGRDLSEPSVQADLRDWYRKQLAERDVRAVTPFGAVDHERLTELAFGFGPGGTEEVKE